MAFPRLILPREGYCIVATPLPFSIFDHEIGAADVAGQYRGAETLLKDVYGLDVIQEVSKLHTFSTAAERKRRAKRQSQFISSNLS